MYVLSLIKNQWYSVLYGKDPDVLMEPQPKEDVGGELFLIV